MMSKVGPTLNTKSVDNQRRNSNGVRRLSLSGLQNFLSPNSKADAGTLDSTILEDILCGDLTLGFEESEAYFTELSKKASALLQAEHCYIFLKNETEQNLYTFLKDIVDSDVKVTKPLDRGITGYVLSDNVGLKIDDVFSSQWWSKDVDAMIANGSTTSYLAWPLHYPGGGDPIGVIEFCNKLGEKYFTNADSQLARILAVQLSCAVIKSKQQDLLADRKDALHNMQQIDATETIMIEKDGEKEKDGGIVSRKSAGRYTFALPFYPHIPCRLPHEVSENPWDFDVFLQNEEELTSYAVGVFDTLGLFTRFSISTATFISFLNEIKSGYSTTTPYHSSYHAFDVMHVCYLLITQCQADDYLESFNVLSILVAALAHDLGHDGFNNTFHDTTGSDIAVTYNGISVMENYSGACLFKILRKKENDVFSRLNQLEKKKMRQRLIDMILDTDAKNHFTLTTRFKYGLEMKQLSRGLLSSTILHVADVSNPARPGALARKWAYAVQEEFFLQGDKEKELNIPVSPFMDRDIENLPRMQGAFIDAIVSPLFHLLSEFLPSVKKHFLKELHINRAFWNNMDRKNLIKRSDIIAFLKNRSDAGELGAGISADFPSLDCISCTSISSAPKGPIPGIPANASCDPKNDIRKLSVVQMQLYDDEVYQKIDNFSLEKGDHNKRDEWKQRRILSLKESQSSMKQFIEAGFYQSIMLIATVYALFAVDMNMAVGSKDYDRLIDIGTLFVLFLFLIEIIMSLVCISEYVHFFFWLDLVASVSMFLDVKFLMESAGTVSPNELALAKASRAAKAGARASRILRIIKLVKVIKLFRLLVNFAKERNKNSEIDDDETDEDVELQMSVVARKMNESITRKVVIAVMVMLLLFSLLDNNFVPDARQIQTNSLAEHPESDLLLDVFFESHENIVQIEGVGEYFIDEALIQELRLSELMVYQAVTDPSVESTFDISEEKKVEAWYSLLMTAIVSLLLLVLGMLFSRDADRIMIRPIEKMKHTVQQLSKNPLLHLEKWKKGGNSQSATLETDILEQAINKMARLLQIGFGCAGAEIIGKSLSDMGELDPMFPGVRVNAIFGFCDIRNFTGITELLQEDVMIFVNGIADIIHKRVVDSGGAPNKNIGDAFLLVWKLSADTSKFQRKLFDAALSSFQKVIVDIKKMDAFESLPNKPRNVTSDVSMGFGLHTGWAIEGCIGSKVKVDASYLSPHVNLASRLEAATKKYHVPLLMSQAFVSGLTGTTQSTCRRVDSVTFKGSNDPMHIFHQDVEPFHALVTKPDNYDDLLRNTYWKNVDGNNGSHDQKIDIHKIYGFDEIDINESLNSEISSVVREVYDRAFNAYLDGDWGKCKILCHMWVTKFPGDVLSHALIEHMILHKFKCPEGWMGYHALTEK
mmetsp:Transcript_39068/g.47004  ORF Transcript_39068/g.47004 Transcript_39068/m.47004 type:complete len:1389 (-) Transcript_39068:157-4323(-)